MGKYVDDKELELYVNHLSPETREKIFIYLERWFVYIAAQTVEFNYSNFFTFIRVIEEARASENAWGRGMAIRQTDAYDAAQPLLKYINDEIFEKLAL